MDIELYTSLVKLNASDEDARKVVQALKQYIAMEIAQATQPLIAKMDSVQGTLSAQIQAIAQVKTQTDAERDRRSQLVRWVIGTVLGSVATTVTVLKIVGLLH